MTLRLVLITTGRIPARSHSLMPVITSILESGGTSFSTCRLETASGTGVDAVVLDHILAERGVRRNAGLVNQPRAVAVGHYVGLLAPGQTALRDRCNEILEAAMRDGRLEAILRRWQVWTDDQARLYRDVTASADVSAADPPPSIAPARAGDRR